MRYLVWLIRLIVFVIVLLFAVKNIDPVQVHFFGTAVINNVPLIVVMLVTFVLGGLLGLSLTVPAAMRRRREVARLRREVERLHNERKLQVEPETMSPEILAPFSPL